MPTIKRYTNRKLYDVDARRYVTLEQIGQMVRDGDEVQVVDYATGEDLTQATLLQVLFDEDRRGERLFPLTILTRLVNHGRREVANWMRSGYEGANTFESEFQRRAEELVADGRLSSDEADRLLTLFNSVEEKPEDEEKPAGQSEVQTLLEEIDRLEKRLNDLARD